MIAGSGFHFLTEPSHPRVDFAQRFRDNERGVHATTMQSAFMNPRLGRFLREAREAKGLSQRQLAKVVGISFSSISRMEKGQFGSPDPAKLQRIAGALDVDLEDIYALAGYVVPKGLPEFAPYLRAKYELPETAVKELNKYFQTLQDRYGERDQPRKRGRRA